MWGFSNRTHIYPCLNFYYIFFGMTTLSTLFDFQIITHLFSPPYYVILLPIFTNVQLVSVQTTRTGLLSKEVTMRTFQHHYLFSDGSVDYPKWFFKLLEAPIIFVKSSKILRKKSLNFIFRVGFRVLYPNKIIGGFSI